jgi:threonine/homoserine/homoserine lactone efflux protein
MNLLIFLSGVLFISLTGALQPGPITATAITIGAKNRWAGTLLAIGHGIIEFPLMVVIVLGLGKYFQMPLFQIIVGLLGGAFLLMMGIQTLRGLKAGTDTHSKVLASKPIIAGIVLSASNPYFLIWWATVGMNLATQAHQWGKLAFILFALTHWSVDLVWLQILSWSSYKGSTLLGKKGLNTVLTFCAIALLGFGLYFIYSSINLIKAQI